LKNVLLGFLFAVGCGGGPQPCSVHLLVREGGVTLLHYNANASCTQENLTKFEVADSPTASPWMTLKRTASNSPWDVSYTDTQSWHGAASLADAGQVSITNPTETTFDLVLSGVQLSGADGGTIDVSGEITGDTGGSGLGF
jgi:hypothetical protein